MLKDDGDDDHRSCSEVGGRRPPVIQSGPGGGESMTLPYGGPITTSLMTTTVLPCTETKPRKHGPAKSDPRTQRVNKNSRYTERINGQDCDTFLRRDAVE